MKKLALFLFGICSLCAVGVNASNLSSDNNQQNPTTFVTQVPCTTETNCTQLPCTTPVNSQVPCDTTNCVPVPCNTATNCTPAPCYTDTVCAPAPCVNAAPATAYCGC